MNLLAHVNSLGGFTIKDLDPAAGSMKKFKICGNETPARCIEMPNADGDVFLTNIYRDKAISIDGATKINAALSFTNAGKMGASIRAGNDENTAFIQTGKLGVGGTVGAPGASLHLMSRVADNVTPFKVTVDNSDLFSIDNQGTVLTKKIQLKVPGAANSSGTIEATEEGIKITTAKLLVDGNVQATGTVIGDSSPDEEGFTSGPIKMRGKPDFPHVMTPVDYMNSRYLMPVH
jgi:hypothetical protein